MDDPFLLAKTQKEVTILALAVPSYPSVGFLVKSLKKCVWITSSRYFHL